jgi:hypothetical protein
MSFGARCFLVWVVAMIAIGILALAVGAPVVSFTELTPDGKLTSWQILALGATLTVWGFYSAMDSGFTERGYREMFQLRFRIAGWVFFGGGLLLMLRAVFDFLTTSQGSR